MGLTALVIQITRNPYLSFIIVYIMWTIYPSSGLISITFKDTIDAAFANLQLWSSIGASISYGYSNELCNYVKLYLLLGFVVVAMGGYYTTEWLATRLDSSTIEPKVEDDSVIIDNNYNHNSSDADCINDWSEWKCLAGCDIVIVDIGLLINANVLTNEKKNLARSI